MDCLEWEPRLQTDEVMEARHRAEAAVAVLHEDALRRLDLEARGTAAAAAPENHQSAVASVSFTSFTQNFSSSPRNSAKSCGDFEIDTSVPSRASAALPSGLCAAVAVAS